MADTTLSPTGLVQPEVGASADSWGTKLDACLATINGWFSDVGGAPALKVANGGTGAATAATARTALAVPGTGTANTFTAKQTVPGGVSVGGGTTATIASGAIAVSGPYMIIDTEGAAASDDLDTISGGANGDILIIRSTTGARDVVVRNNGNIRLNGGASFTLDENTDTVTLLYQGSVWIALAVANNT